MSRDPGRYIPSKLWCWYCWSREQTLPGTPVQVSGEKSVQKIPALVRFALQSILTTLITTHPKVGQTISSGHWPRFLGSSTSMKWTRSGQSCPSSQARTFYRSHATWQIHSVSPSIVLCHSSHRSVDAFKKGKQCFWVTREAKQWVTKSMVHPKEVRIQWKNTIVTWQEKSLKKHIKN